MSLVYSVPGKTFIAGEYLAVQEGPALIFLSKPVFDTVISKGTGQVEGIHPDSPAGLFISKNPEVFKDVNIKFKEAYAGKGGFGASTAQFLAVYSFSQGEADIDPLQMLEDYYEVSWDGQGARPSGADLVGQLCGGLTFFKKRTNFLDVQEWPFKDIEFHLVHTGNKIATHEHLKSLGPFDSRNLEKAFETIYKSFSYRNSLEFCRGITAYRQELANLNFTCEQTLSLLQEIDLIEGVKAAKGCGALGADVVLIITEKSKSKELEKYCQTKGLSILTHSKNLSEGLTVKGNL